MSHLWIETAALILSPTCALVVFGFLGRSALNQYLGRRLENHKAELSAAASNEIEKLKAELRKITSEHEIVFSKLHAERAEILKSLYQQALRAATAARSFAAGKGVNNQEDFAKSREALDDALNEFYQAVFRNRIFLSESLVRKIDNLLHDIMEPASNIAGGYIFPIRPDMERLHARLSDNTKLEEATWRLEEEVAKEFRRLLGVK
jgi:hypothetical protein